MTYINIKTTEGTETVDKFETYREAKQNLREYKIASSFYSGAYLSQRYTNDWKN